MQTVRGAIINDVAYRSGSRQLRKHRPNEQTRGPYRVIARLGAAIALPNRLCTTVRRTRRSRDEDDDDDDDMRTATARLLMAGASVMLWCCGGGGGGGPAATALPVRELPYRVNMTELELLEHVLRNETEWRLVLKEPVKGIRAAPPYGDRFAVSPEDDAALRAGGGGGAEEQQPAVAESADPAEWVYDPRAMAVAVVPRFAAVGSMVSFAAGVVHRAAACLAARHLAFQAHYVTLLVAGRTAEPAQILADLSAFRGALARVLDKLTLVPGGGAELDLVLDAYWDTVALMQEDAVHHVRPKPYPRAASDVAGAVHRAFLAYMDGHCARPYRADRRLFEDAGIAVADDVLLDDVLGAVVRPDALVDLGRRHAAFVQRAFYGLGAETLPRAVWTQLFYHARRLPPVDPLNRVNPFVTRQPVAPAQLGAPAVAVNTVLQPGLAGGVAAAAAETGAEGA